MGKIHERFKRRQLRAPSERPGATPPTEPKGTFKGRCNVTACQRPNSAYYFNRVMRAHYCWSCAREIERWAKYDGQPGIFPDLTRHPEDAL